MSRTVLIVEDYDDTRSFMKIMLEGYGYEVIEAADGLQAIERIKHHFPDLILMDVSMPVMDGLTATRTIRKIETTSKTPIIAITAFGTAFYEKAIEAGCNDLISKPIDFDSLEPILIKYLGY